VYPSESRGQRNAYRFALFEHFESGRQRSANEWLSCCSVLISNLKPNGSQRLYLERAGRVGSVAVLIAFQTFDDLTLAIRSTCNSNPRRYKPAEVPLSSALSGFGWPGIRFVGPFASVHRAVKEVPTAESLVVVADTTGLVARPPRQPHLSVASPTAADFVGVQCEILASHACCLAVVFSVGFEQIGYFDIVIRPGDLQRGRASN